MAITLTHIMTCWNISGADDLALWRTFLSLIELSTCSWLYEVFNYLL